MKEIQKVVKKLSREQESAAGGRWRRWRTNRYKNIKSPPVYWGDLINMQAMARCNYSKKPEVNANNKFFFNSTDERTIVLSIKYVAYFSSAEF